MAKKKWYVVTTGRQIGVFTNWLEVAPLVRGFSGAVHQSFHEEEEAWRVFNEQKAKGNTKVLRSTADSTQSTAPFSHSYSTPPPTPSPARLESESGNQSAPSEVLPPRITRDSSSRLPTQGSLCQSSLSSPPTGVTIRSSRLPKPSTSRSRDRTLFYAPSNARSFPDAISISNSSLSQSARIESKPPTPRIGPEELSLPLSPRASVRTPPMAPSYPSSILDATSPKGMARTPSEMLSPLNSPKLTSEVVSVQHVPDSPASGSQRRNQPYTGSYCDCSHVCPDCNRPRHPTIHKSVLSYGVSPAHVPNTTYVLKDPRSPIHGSTAIPMAFEQAPTFVRPSPAWPISQSLDSLRLH